MRKKLFCMLLAVSLMIPTMPVMAEEVQDETVAVQEEVAEEPVADIITEDDETVTASNKVAINKTNFPDEVFREHVKENYDTNGDGYLSNREIEYVLMIDCSSLQKITSLKGIEYFYNLQVLECFSNKISELDLSKCTNLTFLDCGNNKLNELDITKCTNLTAFFCWANNISELDLSKCPNLTRIDCGINNISELDLSKCPNLTEVTCWDNKLSELDLSKCKNLKILYCSDNNLRNLNISGCTKLERLYCDGNELLFMDLSSNSMIKNSEFKTFFNNATVDLSAYSDFNLGGMKNVENLTITPKEISISDFSSKDTSGKYVGNYEYDCGNGNTLIVTLRTSEAPSWQFVDVAYKPGNWKYEAVKYVYDNKIMNGVGDGTRFDPDAPLTREMFATVLYRMAGEPAVTYKRKFPDVPGGKWYSNAVIWASEQGIVSGYGSGNFGTGHYITREQISKMLMEYGDKQGYDVSQSANFNSFADAGKVSGWAKDYMKWAVGSGMIGGSQKNGKYYLNPQGNATRAECATMLKRFMEKYE